MDHFITYCKKFSLTLWIILIFICVNILGTLWFSSVTFDATENKRFTISDASLEKIRTLSEPIHIKLYSSEIIASDFPALKNYRDRLNDFLEKMADKSSGKIIYNHILIESYSAHEDEVVGIGLTGIPLKDGRSVFLGLVSENMTDGMGILPFMAPEREAMLEFDIMQLIDGLSRPAKMKIAFSSSLPLSVGPESVLALRTGNIKPAAIYHELKSRYDILHLSDNFDALTKKERPNLTLIAHPRPLSKTAKKNLKNYLASGGRVIAAVDPFSEYPAPPQLQGIQPPILSSSLGGILDEYGVSYDSDRIILDRGLARIGRDHASGRPNEYLAWLKPTKDYIAKKEPSLSYISELSLGTVGALEPKKGYKGTLSFTPLIVSSQKADTLSAKKLASLTDLSEIEKNYIPRRSYILAAKISGQFPAIDKNIAQKPSAMIVIADSDFLDDRFWLAPAAPNKALIAKSHFGTPYAHNGNMVLNMIDYLLGDNTLIALRGRNVEQRTLTYLDDIRKNAEQGFKEREQKLNQEIVTLRDKLASIRNNRDMGGQTAQDAVHKNISDFTARLIAMRAELRHVRKSMNKHIRSTELEIKIINIIVIPLLVGLLPALFLILRRYKQYKRRPAEEKHRETL